MNTARAADGGDNLRVQNIDDENQWRDSNANKVVPQPEQKEQDVNNSVREGGNERARLTEEKDEKEEDENADLNELDDEVKKSVLDRIEALEEADDVELVDATTFSLPLVAVFA